MTTYCPISAIDYVNRAVSTDEGRYNMTGAYRERDRLIATDGHRLHMVSGLVNQDKGGFVDGRDASFPNYETVLPQKVSQIATIKLTKKQVQYLGKIVKIFRDNTCGCKLTFEPGKGLTIEGTSKAENDSLTFIHSIHDVEVDRAWTVGLNLRYLVEAIVPDYPMTISAEDPRGPQLVEADFYGSKYTAVVMPIRLD